VSDAPRPGEVEEERELVTAGVPLPGYPEVLIGLPAGRRLREAWTRRQP
jgi:hypothetical protein